MKKILFGVILYIFTFQPSNGQTVRDSVWADSILQYALNLSKTGKPKEALARLDTVREEFFKIAGKNSPFMGNFYHVAARIVQSQSNLDSAIFLYRKSIEIRRTYLLQDNVEIAQSLNNIGICNFGKGEYQRAIDNFVESLNVYKSVLGPDHLKVADAYNNIGYAYDNLGDYNIAIKYHKKSMGIREQMGDYKQSDVDYSYYNIAIAYKKTGEYNTAISYCKKALELRKKIYGPGALKVAAVYNELGVCYQKIGEFDLAHEMLRQSLDISLNKLDSTELTLMYPYYGLADFYCVSGQYRLSIDFTNKAMSVARLHIPENHPYMAVFFNNLSLCYSNLGEDSIALDYLNKSLEIQINRRGAEHQYVATAYNNLGKHYLKTGDSELAKTFFEKALAIQLKRLGNKHPDVANTYFYLGNVVSGNTAIAFYQKALEAINYVDEQPDSVLSNDMAVNILLKIGETYRKTANAQGFQSEALYKAWSAFASASRMIVFLRVNLSSTQDVLTYRGQAIFEGNILSDLSLYSTTDSLHYLHGAFNCVETSHSLSFFKSIRESDALHFAGIPDSLLQREYDLRLDIASYEKKRFTEEIEKKKPLTDSTLLAINSTLFDLKRTYEALKDTFEHQYPDYYRLKYDLQVESVENVQQNLLQPDQALLEYFVGDSSVFIFLVKKDDYRVVEVKKDFPLEDWVKQLRYGIYGYHTAEGARKTDALRDSTLDAYIGSATALYQKLLAPIDTLLPRRVVIVPDGALGYIPFEALLAAQPKQKSRFQEYSYFGRQKGREHSIGYCYSATLLREMTARQHRRTPSETFLAYAPYFDGDTVLLASRYIDPSNPANQLPPLKYAAEEVEELHDLMGGKAVIGKSATKDALMQEAGRYRVVHLSTHGKANDKVGDYSFLAFSEVKDSLENEWLYVRDIYNLTLNADMVVLSACETGIGELKRGEGIISLARAFAYAGAKSIVTTLWSVDDAKTKDFMVFFYRNLKQGMAKDEALAKARGDYFSRHKNQDAHPFFWAGFVGIGDMGAIR